ncbi:MAG: hypothetical protein DHS20C15_20570 [Planctomycetota bacterium]|nr:MAG: hypothetical protein DHS20C15_20570 [Planctomycetota bacterium]
MGANSMNTSASAEVSDTPLQRAARRAAISPRRERGEFRWSLPPAAAALVIYAGLLFVGTLILLVIWRFPVTTPPVLPGMSALATALMWTNACWLALTVVELTACRLRRVRVDRQRVLVLLAALVLTALCQGLAIQVRAFANL